jgi:hypothetical protein
MTHYAVQIHRLPGDLPPSTTLHGHISLHGSRHGVDIHVDAFPTKWSLLLKPADVELLAAALVSDDVLAVARLSVGRVTVDNDDGIITLAVKLPAAAMSTEMTQAEAAELAGALSKLLTLPE